MEGLGALVSSQLPTVTCDRAPRNRTGKPLAPSQQGKSSEKSTRLRSHSKGGWLSPSRGTVPRRPCLPQPVWDAILASGGPPNFGGLLCVGKWFISFPYCWCNTLLSGFNHAHLLFYSLGGQKCETHLRELKSRCQQIALLSGDSKGKPVSLHFQLLGAS